MQIVQLVIIIGISKIIHYFSNRVNFQLQRKMQGSTFSRSALLFNVVSVFFLVLRE